MKKNEGPAKPPSNPRIRPLPIVRPAIETGLTGPSLSSTSQNSTDFLRYVQATYKGNRPKGVDTGALRAARVPISSTSSSSTLTFSDEGKSAKTDSKLLKGANMSALLSARVPILSSSSSSALTSSDQCNSAKTERESQQRCEEIAAHLTSLSLAAQGQSSDPQPNQIDFSGFHEKIQDRTDAGEVLQTAEPTTQPSVNSWRSNPEPKQCNPLPQMEFPVKIEDGTELKEIQAPVTASCATVLTVDPGLQSTCQNLIGQTAGSTRMSSSQIDCEHKPPETGSGPGGMDSKVSQPSEKAINQVGNSNDEIKGENLQPLKEEKVTSRKRKSDSDCYFKVRGKLYQKLGRIGRGGSSEVYKVIAPDGTIYALKKIFLKGRDYPTAYGFCQEIEYLKILRGKSNIIQLIDYEATDKALFEEVLAKGLHSKESNIKDDAHIYMVLEYGEIDLACMLSIKWKNFDECNWKSYENWIRFYWQQMLEAVNTIHEERIVHSDLKPANFLLVRGSLKLIDFGIAKAISSDTTNIQRESQVGTLNYMSPEAFLCNEQDAGGKTIKCGRSSDIWSLGCILYQMVYGKTPFADHTNIWTKYKVVTDRNHKIVYKPVSDPLLIDLMKRCLAWDRDERWRIPQLLKHPFVTPFLTSDHGEDQTELKPLFQKLEIYSRLPECSEIPQVLKTLVADCEAKLSSLLS